MKLSKHYFKNLTHYSKGQLKQQQSTEALNVTETKTGEINKKDNFKTSSEANNIKLYETSSNLRKFGGQSSCNFSKTSKLSDLPVICNYEKKSGSTIYTASKLKTNKSENVTTFNNSNREIKVERPCSEFRIKKTKNTKFNNLNEVNNTEFNNNNLYQSKRYISSLL